MNGAFSSASGQAIGSPGRVSAGPGPSSYGLMALGLGLLTLRRFKRR